MRRTRRSLRPAPVITGLALLVLITTLAFAPFLTREREVYASTPTPPALFAVTPIPLADRATLCIDGLTFSPQTEVARIRVVTNGLPGPRLTFTMVGRGLSRAPVVAEGYPDTEPLDVRLRPPPRATRGALCMRAARRRTVEVAGVTELRVLSPPVSRLNGQGLPADVSLAFLERRPATPLGRLDDMFGHAASALPVGPWLFWVLSLLVVVGLPTATLLSLWLVTTRSERR